VINDDRFSSIANLICGRGFLRCFGCGTDARCGVSHHSILFGKIRLDIRIDLFEGTGIFVLEVHLWASKTAHAHLSRSPLITITKDSQDHRQSKCVFREEKFVSTYFTLSVFIGDTCNNKSGVFQTLEQKTIECDPGSEATKRAFIRERYLEARRTCPDE
jgi:hypothetical protein